MLMSSLKLTAFCLVRYLSIPHRCSRLFVLYVVYTLQSANIYIGQTVIRYQFCMTTYMTKHNFKTFAEHIKHGGTILSRLSVICAVKPFITPNKERTPKKPYFWPYLLDIVVRYTRLRTLRKDNALSLCHMIRYVCTFHKHWHNSNQMICPDILKKVIVNRISVLSHYAKTQYIPLFKAVILINISVSYVFVC